MANKTQYTHEQAKYLCDLFKTIPAGYVAEDAYASSPTKYQVRDCVLHGFVVVDTKGNPLTIGENVFDLINDLYGINADQMNATFYKSFKKVAEMDRFDIFVDQIIHYFGTYGMEAMGLDPITIVPVQDFEVPDVDVTKIKITVIHAAGDGHIVNLVNEFATETIAPSKRMTAAFKEFLPLLDVDLNDIQSFELSVMAFDYFGKVPRGGKQFLRYVIYKATGATLIVKNKRTCDCIKAAQTTHSEEIGKMFAQANPVELAGIFLRYKPLFLAFKGYEGCAPIINKLRRLADTYHEPLSDNTIQYFIAHALNGHISACRHLQEQMSARDCVKLLNAMLLRLHVKTGDPAVYNVRNGRTFVKEDAYVELTDVQNKRLSQQVRNIYTLLATKMSAAVEGKTFYVPDYIKYAVPHTEKQFVNNLPWGTTIIPGVGPGAPMTVGVSWFNSPDGRVDLDLHAFTPSSHFGWNASFSNGGGQIVYTGDMTNAPEPNGAAEAYWMEGVDEPVIFQLNEFCGPAIPFKLYLSEVKPTCCDNTMSYQDRYSSPYTMDAEELVIPPVTMHIGGEDERGMTLGYYHKGCFTLYSGNLSNSAVPRGDFKKYIEAIIAQQSFHLNLADLLSAAGATVLYAPDQVQEAQLQAVENGTELEVIDLSPEKLTATTLLGLVDGKLPQ